MPCCVWEMSDGGCCGRGRDNLEDCMFVSIAEAGANCENKENCPEGMRCDNPGVQRKLFGQMVTGVCV